MYRRGRLSVPDNSDGLGATGLTQPICESHRKPAKFRVVKDMLKHLMGDRILRVQVGRILAPYVLMF